MKLAEQRLTLNDGTEAVVDLEGRDELDGDTLSVKVVAVVRALHVVVQDGDDNVVVDVSRQEQWTVTVRVGSCSVFHQDFIEHQPSPGPPEIPNTVRRKTLADAIDAANRIGLLYLRAARSARDLYQGAN